MPTAIQPATSFPASSQESETRPRLQNAWLACLYRVHLSLSYRLVVYPVIVALWVWLLVPTAMPDPDLWWHLRNGAVELHTRSWMHRDLYSFTAAGAPWIDHEWLGELPFYAAWHLAGPAGLYPLTLLIIEFIFIGVLCLSVRSLGKEAERYSAASPAAVFATIFAAVLATVSFGPRTLLFGWACLVVELMLLQLFTCRPRTLFTLPLLFLLWINLHGSWLIGIILFFVFILCGSVRFRVGDIVNAAWTAAQWRVLAVVAVLCLAALFINPYGWRLVAYPFDLAFQQQMNVASVQEWQPLNFQSPRGLILMLGLLLLGIAQLVRRKSWTLSEIAFALIGVYAGCRHARFLFLAGILLAPVLSRQLDYTARVAPRRRSQGALTACLMGAMMLVVVAIKVRGKQAVPDKAFPGAALSFLKNFHFNGPLFNECLWGGYLAYHLPGTPVFIDSRMDIYERNGTLRDYLDIIRIRNSLALLDRYNIRYVLFEKETPLVYLLERTKSWKADYDDGNVILMERNSPLTAPIPAAAAP